MTLRTYQDKHSERRTSMPSCKQEGGNKALCNPASPESFARTSNWAAIEAFWLHKRASSFSRSSAELLSSLSSPPLQQHHQGRASTLAYHGRSS